jgi:hypothetical protein
MFNLFVEVVFGPRELSLKVLLPKAPLWIQVLLMLALPWYRVAPVPTPCGEWNISTHQLCDLDVI